MAYMPIFVEMAGRRCLIVGGGAVAERRIESLVTGQARVTVVSPAVTDRICAWAHAGRLDHVPREYRAGDLAGAEVVFIATDDRAVTPALLVEARERSVWVNAADDPEHSDFILPSVLRRGELVVAVGTGGSSPALARVVREELEAYVTDNHAVLSRIAAEVRRALRARGRVASAESWRRALADRELWRLIGGGRTEDARTWLRERLEESGWRSASSF